MRGKVVWGERKALSRLEFCLALLTERREGLLKAQERQTGEVVSHRARERRSQQPSKRRQQQGQGKNATVVMHPLPKPTHTASLCLGLSLTHIFLYRMQITYLLCFSLSSLLCNACMCRLFPSSTFVFISLFFSRFLLCSLPLMGCLSSRVWHLCTHVFSCLCVRATPRLSAMCRLFSSSTFPSISLFVSPLLSFCHSLSDSFSLETSTSFWSFSLLSLLSSLSPFPLFFVLFAIVCVFTPTTALPLVFFFAHLSLLVLTSFQQRH